jgi:hypothetical protein
MSDADRAGATHPMHESSTRCRIAAALLAASALAGCAWTRPAIEEPPLRAWVQAAADGGFVVRAVTTAANCPHLGTDKGSHAMALRAPPVQVAPRSGSAQPDSKASVFEELVCEAAVPRDATRLMVGGVELPLPRLEPRRIVLIGDTGCRMKQSEAAFQDCNDPVAWPFAAVARKAAAQRPDLVVHVGDLHYRESPCPPQRPGCKGSPWGYGADAWKADLFRPAAPLLAAAPWVFVRGNHESCSRAGVGWFRYVDARAFSERSSCERPEDDTVGEFTEPFSVSLGADTQLIVFDSSFVAGRPYDPAQPAFRRYAELLGQADALARRVPHSLFTNHHPVLAFSGSDSGLPKISGAGLRSVMAAAYPTRLYAEGVDLSINGHVHLFEALDFSTPHPGELLVGNGGSAMEGRVDPAAARRAQPAPGAVVRSFVSQPAYGFATLERTDTGWLMTEWSVAGEPVLSCSLRASQWSC